MIVLAPHQESALKRLITGSVLNGGVGSGKSIVALTFYLEQYSHLPLVIITTAQKRDTREWEADIQKMSTIVNLVAIDSWNNICKYANIVDSFFIFDEDRVTGGGLWAKTFIKIAKCNEWIMLSATPGDCWMDYVPLFLARGWYKSKSDFVRQHVVYSPWVKYPKVDHYENVATLVDLRNALLCDMTFPRSTVQNHIEVIVDYDVNMYRATLQTRWNPFSNQPCTDVSSVCHILRRIVYMDQSRLIAMDLILSEHPKAIVFYNFDYELDALRNYAYARNIEFGEWNGHRHQQHPEGNTWLYMVQYLAGREGWNCVDTDTMIFYSSSYSNRTMVQAAGRIDRLTTSFHDLWYYHLTAHSPIEDAIDAALKRKKDFNERKWFGGSVGTDSEVS